MCAWTSFASELSLKSQEVYCDYNFLETHSYRKWATKEEKCISLKEVLTESPVWEINHGECLNMLLALCVGAVRQCLWSQGKQFLLVPTLQACERPRLNLKTSTFIIVTHFPKPPDHVHAPKPPSSGNVQIGKLNAT